MIPVKAVNKLEKMLHNDIVQIQENAIFKSEHGYEVFNRYTVTKHNSYVKVLRGNKEAKIFSSTRNALSWCVADKYNQIKLADKIELLDQQRIRLHNDVSTAMAAAAKIKDYDFKEIVELKLDTKQRLLKKVEHGLDKCVTLAKYWQLRGFNDEIERTRRTASNKENRASLRVVSRQKD